MAFSLVSFFPKTWPLYSRCSDSTLGTILILINVRKIHIWPYTIWINKKITSRTCSVTPKSVCLTNDIISTWGSIRESLMKELMNNLLCRNKLLCQKTNSFFRGGRKDLGEWQLWVISQCRGTSGEPHEKFWNVKCVCCNQRVKKDVSWLMLNLQKIPIYKSRLWQYNGPSRCPCPNLLNLCIYPCVTWLRKLRLQSQRDAPELF